MFFSKKTKGFFVEMNEGSVLLARTNSVTAPMEVEELRECSLGEQTEISEILRQLQPRRPPSGYLHAVVGAYPARRLVRRHTLELKKMKEQGYMADVFTQQLRIEQDKFTIAMINAGDGADYDLAKANQKDVIFCGAPNDDITATQETLLNAGIYPERLELGTSSTTWPSRSPRPPRSSWTSATTRRTASSSRPTGSRLRGRSPRAWTRWSRWSRRSSGSRTRNPRGSSFARTASTSPAWGPSSSSGC
jgi:hypothetical protein